MIMRRYKAIPHPSYPIRDRVWHVIDSHAIDLGTPGGLICRSKEESEEIADKLNAHDEMLEIIQVITDNAVTIADPDTAGTTDTFSVPIEDIKNAMVTIAYWKLMSNRA